MKKKNKKKVLITAEALSVLLCNMDGVSDHIFIRLSVFPT